MAAWTSLVPAGLRQRYWRACQLRAQQIRFGLRSPKYAGEMAYWQMRWERDGGGFQPHPFERHFLAMAGESNQEFLRDRIVADLGCGPRGSLNWATAARARIGIDVLADAYSRFDIRAHNMVYVCSSESQIPLPSNYVDVLFTLNALDHVDDFAGMCREMLRILAPGGLLIASLNLDEPATVCEPQTLTAELVEKHLVRPLEVLARRAAPRGPDTDPYQYMFESAPAEAGGTPLVWLKARKPG